MARGPNKIIKNNYKKNFYLISYKIIPNFFTSITHVTKTS